MVDKSTDLTGRFTPYKTSKLPHHILENSTLPNLTIEKERSGIWGKLIKTTENERDNALLLTDKNGKIRACNSYLLQETDYCFADVYGQDISFLIKDLAPNSCVNPGDALKAALIVKNGRLIPLFFRAHKLNIESQESHFLLIGKNEDSHTRECGVEDLMHKQEELEDLVSLISHNLKAPLVSVDGFVNLLLDDISADLTDEHQNFLVRIQKNVDLMNKMITRLLNFSRFGKLHATFDWVGLDELVHGILLEMRLNSEFKGMTFHVTRRLPKVYGHLESLKTLFENLLGNAAKYRRPGEHGRIEIHCEELPRFHAIHIKDNGIGFEPDFIKQAFDIFKRGINARGVSGSGVGLAICKRIVEHHRGLIQLKSNPLGGATVSFTLPKRQPKTDAT